MPKLFDAEIEFLKERGIKADEPDLLLASKKMAGRVARLQEKIGQKTAELAFLEGELGSLQLAKAEIAELKAAVRDLVHQNVFLWQKLEEKGIARPNLIVQSPTNEAYKFCQVCKRRLSKALPVCPVCFPEHFTRLLAEHRRLAAESSAPRTPRHPKPEECSDPPISDEGRNLSRNSPEHLLAEGMGDSD